METAKQRLTAASHKIARYKARVEQFQQNRQFVQQPGRVYSDLKNESKSQHETTPDKSETTQFWNNIWSQQKTHNAHAAWISDCHHQMDDDVEQKWEPVSQQDVLEKSRKMSNWKTPGHDKTMRFGSRSYMHYMSDWLISSRT